MSDAPAPATGEAPSKSGRYGGQFRPEFSRLHLDPDLLWITPLGVRYVVGVVGKRCAGKSTVVSYLSDKRGFEVFSLSALVREVVERRGLPRSRRDVLQRVGDELRIEHRTPRTRGEGGDGGFLARQLLRRIHFRHHSHRLASPMAPRIVVTGFKHPDELRVFLGLTSFRAFLLDASDETRARRAIEHGILARELRAQDFPASVTAESFFAELDRPDLDGRTERPWASDCAQNVEGAIEEAKRLVAKPGPAAGTGAYSTARVIPLANDRDFADESGHDEDGLFTRIDAVVEQLDREFLSG